ncbi:MAG: acyl-CoA thioesterase/BAAT N-terminal domain-containing protein, partial [Ktedonobacterales bacterium]
MSHILLSNISNPALVDEPLHIQVAGLAPGQEVTVAAHMVDGAGRGWSSSATCMADEAGAVDLATAVPLAGSYEGADAMGLFWAMAPDATEDEIAPFTLRGLEPLDATLTATVEGEPVACAAVERRWLAPGVTRTEVRERGLVGVFFQPGGSRPHPAVLALGGSSGGLREHQAALLASHGVAALALAYFGVEGLPARLANIPLEYFATALEWLAGQRAVRSERIAALGISRGAELALLLGSTYPRIGS